MQKKKKKRKKKEESKKDMVPALKELTVYYGKTDKQLIDKTLSVTIEPCIMCCKDIMKEGINFASEKNEQYLMLKLEFLCPMQHKLRPKGLHVITQLWGK